MREELGKSLHVSHRPLGTEAHSWGGDKHVVLAPSSLGKPLLGAAAGGAGGSPVRLQQRLEAGRSRCSRGPGQALGARRGQSPARSRNRCEASRGRAVRTKGGVVGASLGAEGQRRDIASTARVPGMVLASSLCPGDLRHGSQRPHSRHRATGVRRAALQARGGSPSSSEPEVEARHPSPDPGPAGPQLCPPRSSPVPQVTVHLVQGP